MIEPHKRFCFRTYRFYRLSIGAMVSCAVVLFPCGGCIEPIGKDTGDSEQVVLLRKQIGQLERDQVTLQENNNTLTQQVRQLRRLGDKRLDLLNPPVRIEIERMSGGFDDDKTTGDDGVVVYLRPIDADGDVIKATGDIDIQLWDLAGTPDELLVGQYLLDAEHARENWFGKLITNHYTIKCPWRSDPPKHNEITVRVLFTDYITGEVLSDQRVVGIFLAPRTAQQP